MAAAAAVEQQKHLSPFFREGISHTNTSEPIGQTNQKELSMPVENFTLMLQVTAVGIYIQYTNLWTDRQAYSIDY